MNWRIQVSSRVHFLPLTLSKFRLCSGNHRAGYFSNLACDWLSIVWTYSEQETENGPRPKLDMIDTTEENNSIVFKDNDIKICSECHISRLPWIREVSALYGILDRDKVVAICRHYGMRFVEWNHYILFANIEVSWRSSLMPWYCYKNLIEQKGYPHTHLFFRMEEHEKVPPCTLSRVNVNYEWIDACDGVRFVET